MNTKTKIGLLFAIGVIALSYAIPPSTCLGRTGITTIALLVAFLILLVLEALPIVLTCFIFLAIMPILHVTQTFPDALSGFSNQVVFFILASFGIAAAFEKVPLSQRVLKTLLMKYGKSTESILLSMMIGAAVISSVVSNVPCCAIFMAIALRLLNLYSDKESEKQSGRAFMIAIPVASMIGGMMTPAGSSINLLAIGLLEQFTDETITFAQWMAFGIPIAAFALPFAWFVITKVYKPAPIEKNELLKFINSLDIPKTMDRQEKKTVCILLTMLALWILSSWVPAINVIVVALLGCTILCMPGVDVLNIKTFLGTINWDAIFLVATVLSLGNAMVSNKVSNWIITILPDFHMGSTMLICMTCILVFALLVIIPVAPSLLTIMAAPLISLALGAHLAPSVIIAACALCACNCYLLPLDTVTLITYSKGYYSMFEMSKSTFFIQIWITILITAWLPLISRILGLM